MTPFKGVTPRTVGFKHIQPGYVCINLRHNLRDGGRLGLAGTEAFNNQILAYVVGEVFYGVTCPLAEAVCFERTAKTHTLFWVVYVLLEQLTPHEAAVAVMAPHEPKEQVVLEEGSFNVGITNITRHRCLLLPSRHRGILKEVGVLPPHQHLLHPHLPPHTHITLAHGRLNHLYIILLRTHLLLLLLGEGGRCGFLCASEDDVRG